jgi:pSer/pThr/pTyr-binding forkhead associated (FHA) protein
MEVRLVIEKGKKRREIKVAGPSAVLGRGKGNAVRIASADVSRRHCRLRIGDGLVQVEDLNSVNGTFLNGQLIEGKQMVRPGDRLEVGPVKFVVEYEVTPDALEQLVPAEEEDYELIEVEGDSEEEAEAEIELEIVTEEEPPPVKKAPVAKKPPPAKKEEPPAEEEEAEEPKVDPVVEAVAQEEVKLDFTFEQPWEMPEGGDLRDILAQMEEDAPPKPKKGKKKE